MLVKLKEPLDPYHRRRADVHGWLYVVTKGKTRRALFSDQFEVWERLDLLEGRSIATGVLCTLAPEYVETVDAVQEPQGPQLPA